MDASPLNRLAPELRNRIFELALSQQLPIRITNHIRDSRKSGLLRFEKSDRYGGKFYKSPLQPTALTRTCKQLHSETARLFYALNWFIISAGEFSPTEDPATAAKNAVAPLRRFEATIGAKNAGALRDVMLDLDNLLDYEHFTMSPHTRTVIQVVLCDMHTLAGSNPLWGLEAKTVITGRWVNRLVYHKIVTWCVVQLNDPVRALQWNAYDLLQSAEAEADPSIVFMTRDAAALEEEWARGMGG